MFSLSSLIQYPCMVHMRTYLFGELFNSIETLSFKAVETGKVHHFSYHNASPWFSAKYIWDSWFGTVGAITTAITSGTTWEWSLQLEFVFLPATLERHWESGLWSSGETHSTRRSCCGPDIFAPVHHRSTNAQPPSPHSGGVCWTEVSAHLQEQQTKWTYQ